MPQRVTDILPPQEIKIKERKKEKIYPKKEEKVKIKKPHLRVFLISLVSLIVILVGLGVSGYYFSLGVKILIWPKQETLNSQVELTIDKEAKDINIFAKIIPGYLFQEEKTVSQDFPASGKTMKETKAEGIIRIYNNYSTTTQILIATTRFISAEGKLFRSLERVVIPGGKYENGKLQPGYLDIKVRADQPGEEYNIGPSTFSIPGFAGTPKYTGFYGKSFEAMKGGFKGEVVQVTEKDIENAKNAISSTLFEETKKGLKEKISSEFILVEDAIKDKILETPKVEVSENSFKVEIKGVSEAVVFKKQDLENFAKETILFQKPVDKKLYQESLKADYSLAKTETDSGKTTLNLNISAKIFSEINEEMFKENIVGKTPLQITEFLSIQPQIERVEIKLLPFWARQAPNSKDKIRVELRID
jgi:hypothetical protein